jgi:hypothetical protein
MEFKYEGRGLALGGGVTLFVDGKKVGEGRVEHTERQRLRAQAANLKGKADTLLREADALLAEAEALEAAEAGEQKPTVSN